jgi:hypothetical protein
MNREEEVLDFKEKRRKQKKIYILERSVFACVWGSHNSHKIKTGA